MSKKNNKKSKNINRKNYKIESLEPRLMMDATADGWSQELDVINPSSISCFSTSTPEFKNWENTNIRTLFVTDRSTNETRVAKVGDLLGTDKDSLNMASFANTDDVKSDLKKIMSFAIDSLKNDYANTCIQLNDVYKKLRDNTANSTERITLKAKLNAEVNNYFKTRLCSLKWLLTSLK